jgi:hypothetical protein
LVRVHREHDDLRVGQLRAHLTARLDPVDLWHRDVHQDHIGTHGECERYGLGTIAGFSDDVESLLAHRPAQPLTEHPMVIGEHQSNGCHHVP